MQMSIRLSLGLAVLLAIVVVAARWPDRAHAQEGAGAAPTTTDAEIQALLTRHLSPNTETGIVVGVTSPAGRRVIVAGRAGPNAVPALDSRTVFEIGSVTKVFTTAVLMDMVRRKEVSLDDPVARYLPASVKVPSRGGKQITLVDLATHTSGLPRVPSNLNVFSPNPYANYSPEQLYEFLSGYQLTRDIGERFEYSNLGMGLLGHALARRA